MDNASSIAATVLRSLTLEQYGNLRAEELLERFARCRDESAFVVLVERYGGLVLRRCRAVLQRDELAQEAFQETFFALAQQGQRIRAGEALVSWLERTAYRRALGVRRSEHRRLVREQTRAVHAESVMETSGATAAERAECAAQLKLALAALPDRYRLPLEMVYLDSKSHAEAALSLAWPKGTVDANVKRGLERLKATLRRAGFGAVALSAEALLAKSAQALPAGWAVGTARAALLLPAPKAVLFASLTGVFAGMGTRPVLVTSTLVLVSILAGTTYVLLASSRSGPAPEPAALAGRAEDPQILARSTEPLQAKNLRFLRQELLTEMLATLKPLALGGGEVVVTSIDAYDTRVRCEFEVRHRIGDKDSAWKSRLLLIYNVEERTLERYSDSFASGTWAVIDPGKQIILLRLKPFNKEFTLQLEPLNAAFAVIEKMPRDARGAEESARHREAVRKATEPLLGKWLWHGDPSQPREVVFSAQQGVLFKNGQGTELWRLTFGAFWQHADDGSLIVPAWNSPVEAKQTRLTQNGRRMVFENSGEWWERP